MLYIVIDSSILRKKPKRDTPAFRALTRLCRGNKTHLFMPHIVRREFLSQQEEILTKALKTIASAAGTILEVTNDTAFVKYADSVKQNAFDHLNKVQHVADTELKDWLEVTGAEDLAVDHQHTLDVIEDYFGGNAPFAEIKSRKDIPDSFIFRAIVDVAGQCEKLHFIVGDGRLHDAAAGLANVAAHKSLEEFVRSPECQEEIRRLASDTLEENIERITPMLVAQERILNERAMPIFRSALLARRVADDSLFGYENEATIKELHQPFEISLDPKYSSRYGGTEVGISLTASVECTLDYALYKGDHYRLSTSGHNRFTLEDLNEHYYGVSQRFCIDVHGTLALQFGENKLTDITISDEELHQMIPLAEYTFQIDDLWVRELE